MPLPAYPGEMPSLAKYLSDVPGFDVKASEWLQLLVGDWSLLSDLLRSDLVLWVLTDAGPLAVAHCRPTTGPTVYYEDPVSLLVTEEEDPQLVEVLRGRSASSSAAVVQREEREALRILAPVRTDSRTVAVVAVECPVPLAPASLNDARQAELGRHLLRMMATGAYPIVGAPIAPRRGAPRVVDGIVELDEQGLMLWASPNALSAFHRFGVDGDLSGRSLAELSTELIQSRSPVDESLPLVLMGRAAWRSDMQARGGTLSLRAVPLTEQGARVGAIILVRDVSELRRRERELMTRDATIREVHHRVKNNLQTVAALLRLQSRRMSSPEARDALGEAMRRVSTIALVHESLLQGSEEAVYFDEVIDRCLRLAVDAASATVRSEDAPETGAPQVEVRTEKIGKAGMVPAEQATPLALVITELATNAVEHGLSSTGGTLTIRSERTGSRLRIHIEDDGAGMGSTPPTGLGTNIAQTLVQGELGGTLTWEDRPDGGTRATVDAYLDPVGR